MSEATACQVIVCTGTRVDAECARVITEFGHNTGNNGYYFVMKDWLSEDQLSRTTLLWVVDRSTSCDDVHPALQYGIPLLVPEQNSPLRQLCISARCGIWYRDETDAPLCLEYLLASDSIREHLGANGQAYLTASNIRLKDEPSDRAFAAAAR